MSVAHLTASGLRHLTYSFVPRDLILRIARSPKFYRVNYKFTNGENNRAAKKDAANILRVTVSG